MSTYKVSQNVLNRSVLKTINKNNYGMSPLIAGMGAGIIENENKIYTACSLRSAEYPNSVLCAVYAAANNMYAASVVPIAAADTVILPAEFNEAALQEIIKDIKKAADFIGVPVVAGHTAFSDSVTVPQVSITMLGKKEYVTENTMNKVLNTSRQSTFSNGCGLKQQEVLCGSIIMAGYAGIEGTLEIYSDKKEELTERFSENFLGGIDNMRNRLCIKQQYESIRYNSDVIYTQDVSESGIFGALWEMSEYLGCGMKVYLKKIGLMQETIELCELYDINPYILKSLGAQLIVTRSPESVINDLAAAKIAASVIGTVEAGNDKIIINEDETRYLEPYRMPKF